MRSLYPPPSILGRKSFGTWFLYRCTSASAISTSRLNWKQGGMTWLSSYMMAGRGESFAISSTNFHQTGLTAVSHGIGQSLTIRLHWWWKKGWSQSPTKRTSHRLLFLKRYLDHPFLQNLRGIFICVYSKKQEYWRDPKFYICGARWWNGGVRWYQVKYKK